MLARPTALGLVSVASVASIMGSMLLTSMLDFSAVPPDELLHEASMAFVTPLALLAIVGWPAYFMLMRLGWLNGFTISLAGLAMGALPAILASYVARAFRGHRYSGTWHGRDVQFIVDNQLTLYGWLSYADITILAGLHGVLGALVFHYAWRRLASAGTSPRA